MALKGTLLLALQAASVSGGSQPGLTIAKVLSQLSFPRYTMMLTHSQSIQLDLEPFYNNKAFGTYPGEAAFDALNQSYPSPNLGKPYYTSKATGIVYSFPGYTGPGKPDNVICNNQTISVPPGSYFSASFLVAADVDQATVAADVVFTYEDGSTSAYELRALNFYEYLTINRGEMVLPSRFTGRGANFNTSHIFERTSALSVGKRLASVTLPTTTNATAGRQHVFAVSLWRGAALGVQAVRPTQKWLEGDGAQAVEVTVNNAGTECVSGGERMLSLAGPGFETTRPGRLRRLCPGDQKVVTVGVRGSSNGSVSVEVVVDDGNGQERVPFEDVSVGLTEWTEDLDNLARHESPDWFNDAKFGIFIHWGPYSVTGKSNPTFLSWYEITVI